MAKSSDVPKFGVLQGLKILSTGTVVAQPYSAALAADWGAEVIQIENAFAPDTVRSIEAPLAWSQERRNTRTIALNIPSDEGREVFLKLCEWADIWMESSKPPQYEKWGLTDEVVWQRNPKLVILHTSGYGLSGDPFFVERASYDAIGQAFGGYMYINGMPDGPPLRANPYTCDYITALTGLNAALAAYINAQRTGKGESIDNAQYEAMLRIECHYPLAYLNKGKQIERSGNPDPSFYGYNAYQCKDGEWVFIGMAGPGVFARGVELFGLKDDPDFQRPGMIGVFAGDPAGPKLDKAITEFCASRTQEEVDKECAEAKVPCGMVMKYEKMVKNPQYIAREDFIEWDDPAVPGGKVKGIAVLPKFKNNPGRVWRAGPTFGMDNEDILEELGYSSAQIKEFYEKKVIAKGAPQK